jgi:hypothetical protein
MQMEPRTRPTGCSLLFHHLWNNTSAHTRNCDGLEKRRKELTNSVRFVNLLDRVVLFARRIV